MTNLVKKSGVTLIKAGTYHLNDLEPLLEINHLKSQMAEVSVTHATNPLTVGFFAMQPGVELEYTYEFVEFKVVTKGTIIVRDEQGTRHIASVGDVILFSPTTTVVFEAESNGEAVYTAHRACDESFAPKS